MEDSTALETSNTTFATTAFETLALGGPVVAILLAMSVVALTVIIAKHWQLVAARIGDLKDARRALGQYQRGATAEAITTLRSASNPVAQALLIAIRGLDAGANEERVREEVLLFCADALASLRSWLRTLEVIASLAPLLGLLGTVLGMIEAFQQLESAGNRVDPSVLSAGIWQALLTTAVGLAVAIPVVAFLNWFERRIDRVAEAMDSIAMRAFTVSVATLGQEAPTYAGSDLRTSIAPGD
ncbi:MAG: MotA/TolQ/ExbB proton channel family protein [Pseudomonadota bacterium]